jgi:hypothetical protein
MYERYSSILFIMHLWELQLLVSSNSRRPKKGCLRSNGRSAAHGPLQSSSLPWFSPSQRETLDA